MTKLSEQERREWIERRPRESAFWAVVHFLGSLRLAMLLLAVILIAIATATICESKFNAKVAQHYIYQAPWFTAWLGVLCVNLAAVVLTRWPLQKKHLGFSITHLGIITLLIGAVVGNQFGFEASLTLNKNESPTSVAVLDHKLIQLSDPRGDRFVEPLAIDVHAPSERAPLRFAIPKTNLDLVVSGYSKQLEKQTSLTTISTGTAAVQLRFSSGMMGQSVPMTLSRESAETSRNPFFGLANVELLDALPKRESASTPTEIIDEHQMIFAGENSEPVVSEKGAPSGYRFQLAMTNGEPQLIAFSPSGQRAEFAVKRFLGQSLPLGEGKIKIVVSDYWPDFAIRDGKPTTLSNAPNRPAVHLAISGKTAPEIPKSGALLLEMAVSGDQVLYQLSRAGIVYSSGSARRGESFPLGWADWRAALLQSTTQGAIVANYHLDPTPNSMSNDTEGIRISLRDESGKTSEPIWISSGDEQTISLAGKSFKTLFGFATQRLPFAVSLVDFQVPRDEGSSEPSDFISVLRFQNLRGGGVENLEAHMNHPASYPSGFWRTAFGTNYKVSQVSWNPLNLNQTSLQILHDPGWPLKWIGSLLICAGIALMFYLMPRREVNEDGTRDG